MAAARTLDEVQDAQLALRLVAQHDEVERRKVAVDELGVLRCAEASAEPRAARHTADAPCQTLPRPPRSCTGCQLRCGVSIERSGSSSRHGARTAARYDAVHGAQQLLLLVNRLHDGRTASGAARHAATGGAAHQLLVKLGQTRLACAPASGGVSGSAARQGANAARGNCSDVDAVRCR